MVDNIENIATTEEQNNKSSAKLQADSPPKHHVQSIYSYTSRIYNGTL